MRIPKCIDLDEDIKASFKPGAFHDWKEYLLGICLLPIGIGLIMLLTTEINRLTTTYFLTTKRLLQESRFFSKKVSIPYHLVEDLHFHQTSMDKMLNTGSIIVETKRRKKSELIMKSVADPFSIKKMIEKEVHASKRKLESLKSYM